MNGVSTSPAVPRLPIVERVQLTFRQSPHFPLRDLSAADINGTIVLTGAVPSYYMKQVAQVIAAAVEGVWRLENRTVVSDPASAGAAARRVERRDTSDYVERPLPAAQRSL